MMKKALANFKAMSKVQKTEFIIASFLTILLLAGFPIYAWFANLKNLETITKIQEPGDIIIRAGKNGSASTTDEADSIINFEMKDLDIKSIADSLDADGEVVAGKPKRFVFSVKPGDYNRNYDLQIAHTTNIPLTYTLYKASAVDKKDIPSDQEEIDTAVEGNEWAVYQPKSSTDENDINYYQKVGTAIGLTHRNDDKGAYGRILALRNGQYYNKTYDNGDKS